MFKSIEEKLKALKGYYSSMLVTETYSDVKQGTLNFGRRTQPKVEILVDEAHNHGIVLGLIEALNLLKIEG